MAVQSGDFFSLNRGGTPGTAGGVTGTYGVGRISEIPINGGTPATPLNRVRARAGTASVWTAENPTLLSGEWGLETDTRRIKIGDGTTTWTALAYAGPGLWTETTDGITLAEGGRYILDAAHTVTLVAMDDGAQIELLPKSGNWSALATQFDYPTGWTVTAGSGVNGSKIAVLVCRTAAKTFTIYA